MFHCLQHQFLHNFNGYHIIYTTTFNYQLTTLPLNFTHNLEQGLPLSRFNNFLFCFNRTLFITRDSPLSGVFSTSGTCVPSPSIEEIIAFIWFVPSFSGLHRICVLICYICNILIIFLYLCLLFL